MSSKRKSNTPLISVDYISSNVLKDSDIFYSRLDDANQLGLTNSVLSTDVEFGSNSVELTNGHFRIASSVTLGINWSFQTWIKLEPNRTLPIISLDSNLLFSIIIDNQLNTITLLYSPTLGDVITIPKPFNITTGWNLIRIDRKATVVEVYVNSTLIVSFSDFYYPVITGDLYLGKDLISANNAYIKGQSLLFDFFPDFSLPIEPPATYRKYYEIADPYNTNSYSMLLSSFEEDSDLIGIYPRKGVFTNYDYANDIYNIAPSASNINTYNNPRGLVIVKEENAYHPDSFVIDLTFSISKEDEDVNILSAFDAYTTSSIYVYFDSVNLELKIDYYLLNSVKQTAVIALIQSTKLYTLVITRNESEFKVYCNGEQKLEVLDSVLYPSVLLYRLNYNGNGVNNLLTYVNLRSFRLFYLNGSYSPHDTRFLSNSPLLYKNLQDINFKYHQIDRRVSHKLNILPFTILNMSFDIETGQTVTVPITQSEYSSDVEYKVAISIPKFTDLVETDVSYNDSFIIPLGMTTYNLDVSLISNLNQSKKLTYFDLVISNGNFRQSLRFNIVNLPAYPLQALKVPGYVEGIFSINSLQGLDGVNASSVNPKINSLYGDAYRISNEAESLLLSSPLLNIRTLFLIYQEVDITSDRVYFGNSNSYTFNGGTTNELVGNLVVSATDFLIVRNDETIIRECKISPNDNYIIRANEQNNSIELINKVNSLWTSSPTILDLNLQSPSTIDNASIDISGNSQSFILGFPNANNGEGVLQVWENISNSFVKQLHLSSPVPAPSLGGFGNKVAISNDGTVIASSEVGSDKVYIYTKTVNWSASPSQEILLMGEVVTDLSLTTNFLLISTDSNNVYVYEYVTNTWTLQYTHTGKDSGVLDKASTRYLISDIFAGAVDLYDVSNHTTSLQSFSGTPLFYGYSIDIYNENVVISDLSKLYYFNSSDYLTTIELDSVYNDFGIYINISNNSIVSTNYGDIFNIFTSDSSSYGDRIIDVYLNGDLVNLNDSLTIDNLNIICFTTALPINIDTIGSGYNVQFGAKSLNGLFLGALFYNQVLDAGIIDNITENIKRYLNIREFNLDD